MMQFSVFELLTLKVFLICSYFLPIQPLCSDRVCTYKKVYDFLGSYSGTLLLLRFQVAKK